MLDSVLAKIQVFLEAGSLSNPRTAPCPLFLAYVSEHVTLDMFPFAFFFKDTLDLKRFRVVRAS